MRDKRYTIIKQDHVATGVPFLGGKEWKHICLPKGSVHFQSNGPNAPRIGFLRMGALDLETREPVVGGEIKTTAQRLFDIVDASASGAFVPIREKDELTYAL